MGDCARRCDAGVSANASHRIPRLGRHARRCRRCPAILVAATLGRRACLTSRPPESITGRGPMRSRQTRRYGRKFAAKPARMPRRISYLLLREPHYQVPHNEMMPVAAGPVRDAFHIFRHSRGSSRTFAISLRYQRLASKRHAGKFSQASRLLRCTLPHR